MLSIRSTFTNFLIISGAALIRAILSLVPNVPAWPRGVSVQLKIAPTNHGIPSNAETIGTMLTIKKPIIAID